MAYLLKYKQWEKLYESKQYGSKKYKRLYEQGGGSTNKFAVWAMFSRTDTDPFVDFHLREYQGWKNVSAANNTYNVGLWEISLKDALLGNWDTAKRIKEVWPNNSGVSAANREVRDTFNFGDVNLKGDKVSGMIMYDPRTDQKVQASGNGLLALIRLHKKLSSEVKDSGDPNLKIEDLVKSSGAIVIEFNYKEPSKDKSAKAGLEEGSRVAQYFSIIRSKLYDKKEICSRHATMALPVFFAEFYGKWVKKTQNRTLTIPKPYFDEYTNAFKKSQIGALNLNAIGINDPDFDIPAEPFEDNTFETQFSTSIQELDSIFPQMASPSIKPSADAFLKKIFTPTGYMMKSLLQYPTYAGNFISQKMKSLAFTESYIDQIKTLLTNSISAFIKNLSAELQNPSQNEELVQVYKVGIEGMYALLSATEVLPGTSTTQSSPDTNKSQQGFDQGK